MMEYLWNADYYIDERDDWAVKGLYTTKKGKVYF